MNTIRWKHRIASEKSRKTVGAIQQRDMVLTQFGFAACVLIADELIGMRCTLQEREALHKIHKIHKNLFF